MMSPRRLVGITLWVACLAGMAAGVAALLTTTGTCVECPASVLRDHPAQSLGWAGVLLGAAAGIAASLVMYAERPQAS